MTRPSDAEESNAPLPDEADPLANLDRLRHSRQRRRNNRSGTPTWPYVSVIHEGNGLVVYPDDATIRVWNDERWDIVRVAFTRDRSELHLTKATDSFGVGVRRYPQQRVSVHVSIKQLGSRARPREPLGACTVRRVGDAFVFNIAEQVIIEPVEGAS